jgi:hypothetical protein
MIDALTNLPVWAQEIITWFLTGTNIASFFGIIAALVKIGGNRKSNTAITTTQIGLLNTMIDKLSDTKQLAENVQSVSSQIANALTVFQDAITMQREANANLATFVMACFNESNLSQEAKAKLQVMADKIFYNDNTQVIEALKTAKANADAAVAEGLLKIDQLQKELEAERQKLTLAQENTKENRRV